MRVVGAKNFHADRQTGITKLIIVFRNFANARKSYDLHFWYKFSHSLNRATLQQLSNLKPSRRLIMGFETSREASNVS